MEECSPRLPDTASMPECITEESSNLDINCWGKLIPINNNLHLKELIDDCYEIGRAPSCDVILNVDNIGSNFFSQISKVHFKLYRADVDEHNTGLVYLEDVSSNGTYVNGQKVGKNNKTLLTPADEISLVTPWNKIYLFVNQATEQNRWLPADMNKTYVVIKELGKGGFGEVKLVMDKKTCQQHAVKKISNEVGERKIFNEINILKKLNHPCIVKFQEVIESAESVYILLEYMPNGNLLKKIKSKKTISEIEAKSIFYQLTLAVDYLHEEGITHRDLKPENILLGSLSTLKTNSGPLSLVKVADFGLSKIANTETNLETPCGTLQYAAPEVVFALAFGPYSQKVDIWSLGVILYACLCGFAPFKQEDLRVPVDPLRWQKKYKITNFYQISLCATDIIRKMVKISPKHRLNTKQILEHPWLQDGHMIEKINSALGIQMDIKSTQSEDDFELIQPCKRARLS